MRDEAHVVRDSNNIERSRKRDECMSKGRRYTRTTRGEENRTE